MLEVGKPFPNFALPDQNGQIVRLSDLHGKWIVLFVYPKDDTPGCTIESKGFSAAKADFDQINTAVLGISADDAASHKSFCGKYGLTVSLLADTNGELLRAAGVGQSEWHGTMYWDRTTFLIDAQGNLRKIYRNVNPEGHAQELLRDVQSSQRLK